MAGTARFGAPLDALLPPRGSGYLHSERFQHSRTRVLYLLALHLLLLLLFVGSTGPSYGVVAAAPSSSASSGVTLPFLVGFAELPGVNDTAQAFAKSVVAETGGKISVSNITYGIDRGAIFEAVRAGRAIGLGPPSGFQTNTGIDPLTAQYLSNDVPFALSPMQFGLLVRRGFGKLWQRVYAPFGMRAYFSGTLIGPQVGDWYKKRITSARDLRGLRLRYSGNPLTAFPGSILKDLGATPVAVSVTAIKSALANGTVDGVELLGLRLDVSLKLWEEGARFLHYPGLQGPEAGHVLVPVKVAAMAEEAVQRAAEDAAAANIAFFYGPGTNEALALVRKHGVTVSRYPQDVIAKFYRAFKKVEALHRAEVGRTNPLFAQIMDEYNAYVEGTVNGDVLSEPAAQLLPARSHVIDSAVGVQVPAAQKTSLCRT